jgi:hypothetical protein
MYISSCICYLEYYRTIYFGDLSEVIDNKNDNNSVGLSEKQRYTLIHHFLQTYSENLANNNSEQFDSSNVKYYYIGLYIRLCTFLAILKNICGINENNNKEDYFNQPPLIFEEKCPYCNTNVILDRLLVGF